MLEEVQEEQPIPQSNPQNSSQIKFESNLKKKMSQFIHLRPFPVILIVTLLVFASISLLTIFTQTQKFQNPKQSATTQTPTPTSNQINISTWKTYTNNAHGYSLKYPSDEKLQIIDCSNNPNPRDRDKFILGTPDQTDCSGQGENYVITTEVVSILPSCTNTDSWKAEESSVEVNSIQAAQCTHEFVGQRALPGPDEYLEVYFEHNEIFYSAYLKDLSYQDTFNQILSTLSFLDENLQTVKLYYHNLETDPKTDYCYANDFVEKQIEKTNTPIEDTIDLLIGGGAPSEFPHPDFYLKSYSLENGILTLEFPWVGGFTTGGSCRIEILATSIEKTAMQFPEVDRVVFDPKVFQP